MKTLSTQVVSESSNIRFFDLSWCLMSSAIRRNILVRSLNVCLAPYRNRKFEIWNVCRPIRWLAVVPLVAENNIWWPGFCLLPSLVNRILQNTSQITFWKAFYSYWKLTEKIKNRKHLSINGWQLRSNTSEAIFHCAAKKLSRHLCSEINCSWKYSVSYLLHASVWLPIVEQIRIVLYWTPLSYNRYYIELWITFPKMQVFANVKFPISSGRLIPWLETICRLLLTMCIFI